MMAHTIDCHTQATTQNNNNVQIIINPSNQMSALSHYTIVQQMEPLQHVYLDIFLVKLRK